MEFWGVEVKAGKPTKVAPSPAEVIHVSQATLAELKNCVNPVMLYAKVGDQKLAIGVLTADKVPQFSFDLVFEKEFELSHNWKNGAVHFTGYKTLMNDDDGMDFSDDDDDENIPLEDKQNGVAALTAATNAKPAAPVAAAKKDDKAEDGSDESDEEDDDSDDSESDLSDKEKGNGAEDDDDTTSDSEESEDSDEETPVKPAAGKKRPPSDTKTPEPKKAKLVTPQKSGGKKAGPAHVDTPHPAKKAGKGDKSNVKTPKSAGQVTCGSCSRTFNSQNGLDSHTKAKHGN